MGPQGGDEGSDVGKVEFTEVQDRGELFLDELGYIGVDSRVQRGERKGSAGHRESRRVREEAVIPMGDRHERTALRHILRAQRIEGFFVIRRLREQEPCADEQDQ